MTSRDFVDGYRKFEDAANTASAKSTTGEYQVSYAHIDEYTGEVVDVQSYMTGIRPAYLTDVEKIELAGISCGGGKTDHNNNMIKAKYSSKIGSPYYPDNHLPELSILEKEKIKRQVSNDLHRNARFFCLLIILIPTCITIIYLTTYVWR